MMRKPSGLIIFFILVVLMDNMRDMKREDIKVLHIVQTLGVGGMEGRIARLATGLEGKGFNISILTLRPHTGRTIQFPSHINIGLFEIASGIHFWRLWLLSRRIRAGRFQIVHTHNWSTMFYGMLAAFLARVPYIIHGELFGYPREVKSDCWSREC
jgi:Glycosyltransferase Family 4